MSTLNVANISDDQSTLTNSANPSDTLNNTTTVDTKYVTNGCAKVWCNFTMDPTAINGSLNVSTVTYPASGTMEQNFTNHMSDHLFLATSSNAGTFSLNSNYSSGMAYQSSSLAGYVRIRATGETQDATASGNGLAIFGDLA